MLIVSASSRAAVRTMRASSPAPTAEDEEAATKISTNVAHVANARIVRITTVQRAVRSTDARSPFQTHARGVQRLTNDLGIQICRSGRCWRSSRLVTHREEWLSLVLPMTA